MDEVYLYVATVETKWLKWFGFILNFGTFPVHSELYWKKDNQYYMAELDCTATSPDVEIVGKGDGYIIQISKVDKPQGQKVKADAKLLEQAIRAYASTYCGYLDGSEERDFYSSPQGYGGPMYDIYTCNTFTSWVLSQANSEKINKPKGAIGWGVQPKFPGPALKSVQGHKDTPWVVLK